MKFFSARWHPGAVYIRYTWTCYVLGGISARGILLLCVLHNGVPLIVYTWSFIVVTGRREQVD